MPAAVNYGDVADNLLLDDGFTDAAFAAGQAARGTAVLNPAAKGQRHIMPPILQTIIAR